MFDPNDKNAIALAHFNVQLGAVELLAVELAALAVATSDPAHANALLDDWQAKANEPGRKTALHDPVDVSVAETFAKHRGRAFGVLINNVRVRADELRDLMQRETS